jgi:hypothetical protein
MSWFPRPVGPRAAFRDLGAFIRQRSHEQRIGAALAILVTVIIVIVFLVDPQINTAPGPQIIYVEQWPMNRTDAEIVEQQKKDQAELEALRKERQDEYKRLENRFGM